MTSKILITNAQIVTPTGVIRQGWLLVEGERIALIGHHPAPDFPDAEIIDASGRWMLPGFIDLHVHGAEGSECMDATAESLQKMARFYGRHGVTGFLATTWTASRTRITNALKTIAECQGVQPQGATILGAHLEGPYLNPQRCGAQDTTQIRRAALDEALEFLDLDIIRLVAVAPEYPENHWLITEGVRRGIAVSAAHTAATYEDMQQAVSLGLSQTTHTFNAMTALNHREPGTVGAALSMPELVCELIADNIHVHPAAMRILYAAKSKNRVILISDAVRGAGLPDGTTYEQDGRKVTLSNGSATLPDGTLAGSVLTMNKALHNFAQATGQSIETIWQTSSLNAARAIGLSHRKGSLEVGKDADLVLVDESVNVDLTLAQGNVIHRNT